MKKRIGSLVSFGLAFSVIGCGTGASRSDLNRFSSGSFDSHGAAAKTLYLTFDDGPGERTEELANYLSQEGIPATFFVVGAQAQLHQDVLGNIRNLGHIVANHSTSHSDMTSDADPLGELADTDSLIQPFITSNVYLFRAPYGSWNAGVASILNAHYSRYVGPIFWDMGGEGNGLDGSYAADWKCWADGVSVKSCADGYLRETQDRGRGIVLMHDIHGRTLELVKNLVPRWKALGYHFAALDQISSIAQEIRASGGTPLDDLPPAPIACPTGYRQETFGKGILCTEGDNVLGPFTASMIASCHKSGGGQACSSMRWHRNLVTSLRGSAVCPAGASLDRITRYCVEDIHAFGPFPSELVAACLALGQSQQVCESARWNKGFLRNLLAADRT